MRRSPIVLTGTAAGLAAVLTFKPHEPTLASASAPAATATAGAAATAAPSSSSTASGKTATGEAVPTRYGNVQIRVTLSGGKIAKLEALQLPANDPRTVQISTWAEPQLRQSALTKQSAAIDSISGATFTSAGYEVSLQSALDKLGYKAPDGSRGNTTMPDIQEDHGGPDGPGGQFGG
jgi:uncharacterized protein with FMN-binding domain